MTSIDWVICKFIFGLRYKYVFKGFQKYQEIKKNDQGALLVLSHTSLLDGLMVPRFFFNRDFPRCLAVETYDEVPMVNFIIKATKSILIPYFKIGSNTYKEKQLIEAHTKTIEELKNGASIALYPSGRLKVTGKEIIGGKISLYKLIQDMPEVKIVLVRVTGLWGSIFSYGRDGNYPNLSKTLKKSCIILLKNLIFFTPRRTVTIEVKIPDRDLSTLSKNELNNYLEEWFNAPYADKNPPEEPRTLVPYYFWQKNAEDVPYTPPSNTLIPDDENSKIITDEICTELAHIANCPKDKITLKTNIEIDLGLDSLHTSALLSFMENKYDLSMLNGEEIETVADAVAIASKHRKPNLATVFHMSDKKKFSQVWNDNKDRIINSNLTRNNIFTLLLETAYCNWNLPACTDVKLKPYTYKRFIREMILCASALQTLPGNSAGILLTTSTELLICTLASLLSGKKTYIIDWMQDKDSIELFLKENRINHVLSSKTFIRELNRIDLGNIFDGIILKEDLYKKIKLTQKLTHVLSLSLGLPSIRHLFQTEKQDIHEKLLFFTKDNNLNSWSQFDIVNQSVVMLESKNLPPQTTFLYKSQPWEEQTLSKGAIPTIILGYKTVLTSTYRLNSNDLEQKITFINPNIVI